MSDVESGQNREILDLLAGISDPLAQALGKGCEVVVHDLTNLENSVYAIAGGVTGRSVGAPPTGLLLRHVVDGAAEHAIGYRTELPGGRSGRSSTIIIRNPRTDEAVAALCLNIDITNLEQAQGLLRSLLDTGTDGASSEPHAEARPPREAFPHTVNELTTRLVTEVIEAAGVPVHLMKKAHKVEVVAELDRRGVFQVKEAVEEVANSLQVTRFTIYNYLNELHARSQEGLS